MKKIIFKSIGYVILYMLVLVFLGQIKGSFMTFTPFSNALFSAIIVINVYVFVNYMLTKSKQNLQLLLIAYFSLVAGILFLRNPNLEYQYTLSWYLPNWYKYLFSNRIVFVNVIGNILLFVPLGFLIRKLDKSKWRYLICLIVIIILEAIQFITKLGVFDLTDVILNYIGILIGFALYHIRRGDTAYENI